MSDTKQFSDDSGDDSGDDSEAELDTGPERTGQQVGPYRLGRRLGRGGMAEVYEAYRTDKLQSRVAIKVLHASYAHLPEYQKRFEAEALTLSKLEDPGVVRIIDFVRQDNNEAFLVMDYLDGTSLATYLKEQPEHRLSVDTALRFCAQAASTLNSIHKLNIMHRDLKPGNLMLVEDAAVPEGNRIKIVDFGIARSTGRKRDQAPALTARGVAIGTLRYMSPEQLDARTVDTYSDVYSLGVVLFECLTGQLPFVGNEAAVRIQILNAEAPTLLSICPTAPPQLSQLLRRMLAKVAGDRPSISEVEQELTKIRCELSQNQRPENDKQDRPKAGQSEPEQKPPRGLWFKSQRRYLVLAAVLLTAAAGTWGFRYYEEPTGPILRNIEGSPSMVSVRGNSRFMMGSTPEQIKAAFEQCKQQFAERLKTSPGTKAKPCDSDWFSREGPRHPVSVGAYSLDRHPVPVESFVAFLNELGPERSVRNDHDTDQPRFVDFRNKLLFDLYQEKGGVLYDATTGRFSIKDGYAKHAIEYVSWFGAWQYCNSKGKRLLTEAEYEYAAFNNQDPEHKVTGLELPGPTAEWVYDDFNFQYPSCSSAPCSGGAVENQTTEGSASRVTRGCAPDELPVLCRLTARTGSLAAQGHVNITFRCAATKKL